jgi:hypothetical protein
MAKPSESFLNWCATEEWDWLLELRRPSRDFPLKEHCSGQWIYEIEKNDGTGAFRWVKIVPQAQFPPLGKTYVLIGGLRSGEWRYWALRWAALNDNDIAYKARTLWSAKSGRPLGPVLKREFGTGETFGIDVRFRYTMMPRRPVQLMVDEKGIPYDLKLFKRIRHVLDPKPKKVKIYPEYIVRSDGTRSKCLLAGLPIPGKAQWFR